MRFLLKISIFPKQYGARRLLSEMPDKGWKLGSIDNLLKTIRKMGTIVRQPHINRPRSSRSNGVPRAQSGGQAKKAPISSWNCAWNCHSPFKYAQDNSPRSPALQILQNHDVMLSWRLKPIASPVSLTDKQPYRLQ